MKAEQRGLNDITTQNIDGQYRPSSGDYELDRSNLHKKMMIDESEEGLNFDSNQLGFNLLHEISICGEDSWVEAMARGDALLLCITKNIQSLDIERLKESINPKMEKPVFLNRNFSKGVILFVKDIITPFCGYVKETGQLAVNTSKRGWILTRVFIPLSKT